MHTQTFVEIKEGIIVEMSGRICKYSAGMMINRDFGMEHQNFEVHEFNSRNDLGGVDEPGSILHFFVYEIL